MSDVKPVDLEGIRPGTLVLYTDKRSQEALGAGEIYFAKFLGTPRTTPCRGDAGAMVKVLDDRILLDESGVPADSIICAARWSAITTRDAEKVRSLLRPIEGREAEPAQIEQIVAAWDAIYPHYRPEKYT